MATFLNHTNCPKCGSRDNLAEYSDGSAWCFGCRFFRRSNLRYAREPLTTGAKKMPYFVVEQLPQRVVDWISSYKVPMHKGEWYWAPEVERAFWRYGDFWIGRKFGTSHGPKWLAFGKKPGVLLGQDYPSSVILVEDILSAKAVSLQNRNSMPLFGTYLTDTMKDSLLPVESIVVWLDRDKAKEATKLALEMRQGGKRTTVIITEKDPKEELCYKSLSAII